MYSVFGCPGTLLLIIIGVLFLFFCFFCNKHSFLYGRNEPLVRYCFLWLLYGRGERFVQYCFLWQSCADAECRRLMGVVVLTRYALPFVGCCIIYHLLCVSIYEKTRLLWNVEIRS